MAVRVRDTPVTRRGLLGAAAFAGAAGVAAGCTWLNSPAEEPPPPPDPLEPLLAATRELAARYEQVRTAHPDLAPGLAALQEAHLAHAAALRELINRPALASPTPTPPAPQVLVPAEADQAVAELREAELEAYLAARQACLAAPAERVARLGAICAARATHLEVLP